MTVYFSQNLFNLIKPISDFFVNKVEEMKERLPTQNHHTEFNDTHSMGASQQDVGDTFKFVLFRTQLV